MSNAGGRRAGRSPSVRVRSVGTLAAQVVWAREVVNGQSAVWETGMVHGFWLQPLTERVLQKRTWAALSDAGIDLRTPGRVHLVTLLPPAVGTLCNRLHCLDLLGFSFAGHGAVSHEDLPSLDPSLPLLCAAN